MNIKYAVFSMALVVSANVFSGVKGNIVEGIEEGAYANDNFINAVGVNKADLILNLGKNETTIKKIQITSSGGGKPVVMNLNRIVAGSDHAIFNIDLRGLKDGLLTVKFWGYDAAGNSYKGKVLDSINKDTVVNAIADSKGSADLGSYTSYHMQNTLNASEAVDFRIKATGSLADHGGSSVPQDTVDVTWSNVRSTNDLDGNNSIDGFFYNNRYEGGDSRYLENWPRNYGYASPRNARDYATTITLTDTPGNVKKIKKTVVIDPIAALEDGGYVVSFKQINPKGNFDIMLQRYDVNGDKTDMALKVNTTAHKNNTTPDVVGLKDGGFVVAWEAEGQIFAQRYDADSHKVKGEFVLDNASEVKTNVAIASLDSGGFVTTWMQRDSNGYGIVVKTFNHDGVVLNRVLLDDYLQNALLPEVTTLSDGSFVVAWQQALLSADGSDYHNVVLQKFSATGEAIGKPQVITSNDNNTTSHESVFVASSINGFVTTWIHKDANGNKSVYMQGFDNQMNVLTEDIRLVNGLRAYTNPEIAGLENGNFALTWSNTSHDGTDIFVQLLDAQGTKLAAPIHVDDEAGVQAEAHITEIDGGFLVSWTNHNGATTIEAQRFDLEGNKIDETFIVGSIQTLHK